MALTKDNHFCILMAVWGEKYCRDFLNLSLPSLLAPGNIPALAKNNPTKFIFLTRLCDVRAIKNNPIYLKLAMFCEVEFISIEDLIVFGNYSTTLTLAYDRAIKRTDDAMLNTYFVFLTSDYLMANGSMEGLIRYLKQGYSGVCAGNFQVLRTEMELYIRERINHETLSVTVSPRELLQESLQHLHPIVMASFYNQKIIHNYYVNRFFYPYNKNILVGRFYLLHMLCIKPEITHYKIGSSCDYSFIPAMCPSGNVGIITDSDDYLVVEIQSKDHEISYISWGEYKNTKLVSALAEWTTKEHRENVKHSIYFHTEDLSPETKASIENSMNEFIGTIETGLTKYPPKPSYNHPYWMGALDSFQEHRRIIKNNNDYDYIDFQALKTTNVLKKLYYLLYGVPPNVYRWHYRWREYEAMKKILSAAVKAENVEEIFVLYESYEPEIRKFHLFLKETLGIKNHYNIKNLLESGSKLDDLQKHPFSLCIYILHVESLNFITPKLSMIRKMLKINGKVLIIIPNEKNQYPEFIYNFKDEFAHRINYVMGDNFSVEKIVTIHNPLTLAGAIIFDRATKIFTYSRKLKLLCFVLIGFPGSICCTLLNFLPKFKRKNGHCTNIITELQLKPNVEQPAK